MDGWFCLTQRKIFAIEQKSPMTSIVGKNTTMEVNAAQKRFGYKHCSKFLLLCSAKKKKFIPVCNKHDGE